MRFLFLFAILISLAGCNSKKDTTSKSITKNLWINQDLHFDTLRIDTTAMIIHGSGKIIRFDTAGIYKSFGNDFYSNYDSLTWGEPGIVRNLGTWRMTDTNLIVENQLIERTFLLSGQKIGMTQIDTFHLIGDSLLTVHSKNYVPLRLVSKEISDLLNRNWSRHQKQ